MQRIGASAAGRLLDSPGPTCLPASRVGLAAWETSTVDLRSACLTSGKVLARYLTYGAGLSGFPVAEGPWEVAALA